jgi:hypothetical protein
LDARYTRKNGAVIATNAAFDPVSRLDFTRALITEIGFPPLDAGSKDVAKLTVKLTPEYTRAQRGGSKGSNGYAKQGIQKRWLQSNFRLKIDGLDCTHVNRIEPLVVVQKVVDHAVGELRDYQKEPAHIEIPNLVVTLAESHAHDFVAWHEDFVIRGNSGENNEKSGTLELLAPNLQEVLFTVGFRGLGIFKLSRVDSGTTIETIPRLQASMYCEEMTFTVGSGAVAAAPPPASASATGQAAAEPAGPVFIGAEEPPLVVVSGANGPVVTEAIPERFTRIERTT